MSKVYRDIGSVDNSTGRVVALGTFDGIHRGHLSVIETVKSLANKNDLLSTIITLYPHPGAILPNREKVRLITSLDERIELITDESVEEVIVIQFTTEIAELTPYQFIQTYLIEKLSTKIIVMGGGHRIGKDAGTGFDALKILSVDMDMEVVLTEAVKFNDIPISSSDIREYIVEGDFESVKSTLGRPYKITGYVESGAGRGDERLGFPTINLKYEKELVYPEGVFAGYVEGGFGRGRAALKIGSAPTFSVDESIIEAHILDIRGNLYGERVDIYPFIKIRDIRKYDDAESLTEQIESDIESVREIL